MNRIVLLLLATAVPAFAQVLTHPTDLPLPEADYARPDPVDYQSTLENGLVAYIAEADQVPLVTLSAFIRAGRVSDESQGAAEALQDAMLYSGPAGMNRTDFAAALEQMTAEYTVDLHDDWTEVTLNVPVVDLERALIVFAGLLRDPAISNANVERLGEATASGGSGNVSGSIDDAITLFEQAVYSGHPYGDKPTVADYRKLHIGDVARYHARHYVPGNVTLAVAGAIDAEAIHARLDQLFGDWQSMELPEVRVQPMVERQPAQLHYYETNKLQSWLVIGHDLPPVPEKDEAALHVMNYIIGAEHLNTRLMVETRYKYGYTNDASGFLEPRWDGPGTYSFRSYSRPEVIENIYRNMVGELIRIREEEVSDQELFVAKGALADGEFQLHYLDGYALTRNFAIERLRYGNHERSASYIERVRGVSGKDVLAAARKYIRPDKLQVVLLGEEPFELRD